MIMREKIARAIAHNMNIDPDVFIGVNGGLTWLLDAADAVLDALREPTSEMLNAAAPCPEHLIAERADPEYEKAMRAAVEIDRLALLSQWRMLIDAAKGEAP